MEHLTAEVLARLVDEAPSVDERAHLDWCEECRTELLALQEQTEALATLPSIRPDRVDWSVVEARLASEGLIQGESRLRRQLAYTPGWMKAAGVVALFAGGIGLGWSMAPAAEASMLPADVPDAVRLAGSGDTVEEAARRVRLMEQQYVEALTRYRELSGESPHVDGSYQARRMAQLERLVRTTETAVREAPADPFFNNLHAFVSAEREAIVRTVSGGTAGTWY